MPQSHLFLDLIPFNQDGGHIQGIQLRERDGKRIVYLSGSSADVAYMAQAELTPQGAKMLRIDTLMTSPFRHAGGFQLHGQYLAVGIEDNQTRNSSQVVVYDLDISPAPWSKPIYTLERNGAYERVTAGAVGMAQYQGKIIVIVADWDSRNLDFYSLPHQDFKEKKGLFQPIGSLEVANLPKTTWSDTVWHAYQNLNLVADDSGLYMIGLAKDNENRQIADLFGITIGPETRRQDKIGFELTSSNHLTQKSAIATYASFPISLKKISSKTFQTLDQADFRAAAGTHYEKGELKLLAAPSYMDRENGINIFDPTPINFDPERSGAWEKTLEYAAAEAHQAASADLDHFYAINNTHVAKYDRKTGDLVEVSSDADAKHLNSGFFHQDTMYIAHSNFPEKPDKSDIRIMNPENMQVTIIKDFGNTEGSLTWVINHQSSWWGMFAYYQTENAKSYLVKWDNDWNEVKRYYFPKEVLVHLGNASISGGVGFEDGFLVTGHDERELFWVRIPGEGDTLSYVNTFPAPFTGQGIAVDPRTGGLVGIDRNGKKILFASFNPQ